ncbi:thioredoxin reductase (NADPH) [Chitinophaga terrae (ex Kim and Jung 2007)]|uniref:Thioredoxin reductase n=1 Tax=Chitinophaga terrae (ex Kim and Jung 2007) TaxID=408074 RepID=A0A1H3WYH6_9BACT|nr:thioredoxin-disulfide reductase [Chitinophaga terrae (ex Kim and Jung 2007)]MDQ0106989.1 thioredoxin reductase (NADPH) [Chitinophaga terrae (ex Kim and Jung 2007)]GEP90235.1 thioredoxin-disulfide reductase [Chitinophaga terrae (ex Kim and Jung 2007)]SDZ92163.1 thioredoxin reductase (NADPH) [Chitinophaga terrae (ex Kim and Jung 2007)]
MENKQQEHVHLLIVGSGPAGYTAAIYAARANLKPVLYQGIQPGGQLTITTEVENYPGYPEGIQGPEMMVDFEKQATRMGADIRYGMATSVDFSKQPYKVVIDEEKEITADAIIIATGASAKWLGLPSEQRLNGSGVSACAVCDGFFFRGKEVAIVGAGDTAAEEALYLSKMCSTVHMLVRRDEMRASKVMQDRVLKTSNIIVYWNSEADEVLGENKVEGLRIYNNKTQEKKEIAVSAFFVAIGHQPNSAIFKDYVELDEQGYIITVPGSTRTNVEGVFACGDVQDKIYRQAVTAAGSGCMAALDAERYLSAKEHQHQ